MFGLPEAKRIRRSDLHTRSTSPSPAPSEPDPELQNQLASHFAALYGDLNLEPSKLVSSSDGMHPSPSPSQPQPESEEDQAEDQAYEFRLFSAPSTTTATNSNPTIQRIILNDEEEDIGTGAFLNPRRPQSYYLHTPASGALKAEYETAAVSGETVLAWREKRAWGLEVPWRVRTIRVTSLPKPSKSKSKPAGTASEIASEVRLDAVIGVEVSEEGKKKTKPSKKRRIILREKARKRSAAEEARRKIAESKEEAEREKKTRRNREKKVKRKMKEKAKKGDTVCGASVDGGDDVAGGVGDWDA